MRLQIVAPAVRVLPGMLLLLLATAAWSQARTVDPYVGQVPVSDASPQSLSVAFERALEQVMAKVTGAPDQVAGLAADGRLGPAGDLVLQHGFVENPLQTDPGLRTLQVRFSPQAVNRQARELGLPFWPLERPETLVWVALQDDQGRRLLGAGSDDDALRQLIDAAGTFHGVPLVLPLMDLNDQRDVAVADIWDGRIEPVVRASSRYGAAQVLVGRAFPGPGGWNLRWRVAGDRFNEGFSSRGETVQAAIVAGIGELARRMGRRQALRATATAERAVTVRIVGLDSPLAYGRAMRYLRNLSVVSGVELLRVDGQTLDLRVATATGVRGLTQVLQTAGPLRLVTGSRPAGIDLVAEPGQE